MAIDQSSLSSITKEMTDSMESPPSSLARPEIPFGQLKTLVAIRISEFQLEHGREPDYVVMGPELWMRLVAEIRVYEMGCGPWSMIWGVQAMVIADFGDEIVCADRA